MNTSIMFLLAAASVASAATFTVTNTTNSGAGSFRQAVLDANSTAGVDTVVFDTAGVFSTQRTINLSTRITVTEGLLIDAPSAPGRRVTLDGGSSNAHLFFNPTNATLTVRNLTFSNGSGANNGSIEFGGAPATLTLALENCIFTTCASAGAGGAVNAGSGAVNLTGCTFTNTISAADGGAIKAGSVAASGCTFTGCSGVNGGVIKADSISLSGCSIQASSASGTGILHYTTLETSNCEVDGCTANAASTARLLQGDHTILRQTSLTRNTASGLPPYKPSLVATDSILLESCTVSGNTSGVVLSQSARFLNCTIYGNATGVSGCLTRKEATAMAGYYRFIVDEVVLTMGNCIVAGSTAGVDMMFAFHSLGGNVIGKLNTDFPYYTQPGSGDIWGTSASPLDPLLDPLGPSEGTGDVHFPTSGSPAVSHGSAVLVRSPDYASPFRDGTGGDRIQGSGIDAGAVELKDSFVVVNTNDNGAGSLRQALLDASGASDPVITFSGSTFGSGAVITLTTPLTVTHAVRISGPDAGVKIRGGNAVRVFEVTAAAGTVELRKIWVADGQAGTGPAVLASGAARVVLRECYLSGNVATSGAGAIHAQGGFVLATSCLFTGNSAETSGGAAAASSGGKFHATNCTFTGNSAKVNGGAVHAFSNGEVRLVNCTITTNTADADANGSGDGGGISQTGAGTFAAGNCIVSGNSDTSPASPVNPDVCGTFTSLGHNLVSRDEGLVNPGGTPFQNGVNGDIVGTTSVPAQPLLNSLANNGGLFLTFKPQLASPCVNAGAAGLLDDTAWPERPTYDTRLQFREILAPDMGAVEVGELSLVKIVAGDGAHEVTEPGGEEGCVTLIRSMPAASLDVTVDLAGTSTAGPGDFTLDAANLTNESPTRWVAHFNAGVQQKILRVRAVDDNLEDPAETVVLNAMIGTGYVPVATSAGERTVTIADEDFVVTNTNGIGAGSFIDKVSAAAASPYFAKVFFDPEVFGPGHHTIIVDYGGFVGLRGVIQGPAEEGASVTIDGREVSSLFFLEDGTDMSIRDLNFTRFSGGVIQAVPVDANPYGVQVWLERCTFHGNSGNGAVVCSSKASIHALNCTFSGNSSTANGGAVSMVYDGNRAPMDFPGGLSMDHCTITGNIANSDNNPSGLGGGIGGGIYHDAADYSVFPELPAAPGLFVFRPLNVRNCIIAQNQSGAGGSAIVNDVTGGFASSGGNQIGASNGSYAIEEAGQSAVGATPNYGLLPTAWRLTAPLDAFGSTSAPSPAGLSALDWNGGHTLTCALNASSPSHGLATGNDPATTDQRGVLRVSSIDSGAFEIDYESYAQWQTRLFGTNAPSSGRMDDPDGDGLVNQMEWQSGTDPFHAGNPLSLQRIGPDWTATWTRSPTVDPNVLKLQISEDLETWSNVTDPAPSGAPTSSTRLFQQVLPPPATNPPRQFLRLVSVDP